MVKNKQYIPYDTFQGAGAPSEPPPQKPDTNPTKIRIIMLIIGVCLIPINILLFYRTFFSYGTFFQHVISATCGGITIAIIDWIIEAHVYKKGLWFCYGGYQKIGKIDFKHVPIDMVIGFIATGFNLSFISFFYY
ncbi:MAG: hypothetical protein ACTSVY_16360 [Candidatus Helarchaeota archaeon]